MGTKWKERRGGDCSKGKLCNQQHSCSQKEWEGNAKNRSDLSGGKKSKATVWAQDEGLPAYPRRMKKSAYKAFSPAECPLIQRACGRQKGMGSLGVHKATEEPEQFAKGRAPGGNSP